jgi:transposase
LGFDAPGQYFITPSGCRPERSHLEQAGMFSHGNRRVNHALPMMAVAQIRCPATAGMRYHERKRREGKAPKEALRCLTRRLPGPACHQLPTGRRAPPQRAGGRAAAQAS